MNRRSYLRMIFETGIQSQECLGRKVMVASTPSTGDFFGMASLAWYPIRPPMLVKVWSVGWTTETRSVKALRKIRVLTRFPQK